MRKLLVFLGVGALFSGCVERRDPPGAASEVASASTVRALGSSQDGVTTSPSGEARTARGAAPAKEVLGTERDNLPFEPDGTRIASIAWRTWI
ncbi:MAG TPA: hypothetical protein PKA88_19230, partial [Polyangiaceae bacterium]|nr:hypothetical protein [Polyangiaceae bacterium]